MCQRCIECLGNRDPVFGRIVGRIFRMGWVAESATRNIVLKRDAVSLMCLKRKAYPIPELQNGMPHSGAPKRDALSARKNCRSCVKQCRSLLAQHQRRELCLGVHHVVGAGGFQLCAAAETPADARTLKAGVVAGQDIDIGIAYVERGRRVGA